MCIRDRFYGKLYIDFEKLAFTRAEFSLDMQNRVKAVEAILHKKPLGLRFRPQEVSYLVTYKEQNGKTYLNYKMCIRDRYTNISLNFGYAYNWVFARNCLACLSLCPAIAYKTSRIEKEAEEGNDWYKNFNIDFILLAGVVDNNSKYFAGASFLGRTYDYYRDNFSLNNGFGTLQIYAGFNFYLKKEHRKKK